MDFISKTKGEFVSFGEGSALTEMLAAEPWINTILVTLPIWLPVVAFCVIGCWRGLFLRSIVPGGFGLRRAWLAYGAAYTVLRILPEGKVRTFLSKLPHASNWLPPVRSTRVNAVNNGTEEITPVFQSQPTSAAADDGRNWVLHEDDLTHFKNRVENGKEKNVVWETIRSDKNDKVQQNTWRHVLPYGGTEYITLSILENANADELFAFYCCDETRTKWDKMLTGYTHLDHDPVSGSDCVSWVRDFPANVVSRRDYVFGRRSWIEGDTFWTVCKNATHEDLPASSKPKRIDGFYSAWRIRQVLGKDGKMSACETLFMHWEEFGIQQDIARFAIRQGLWSMIKNLAVGFKNFRQKREMERAAGHEVFMPVATERSTSLTCPVTVESTNSEDQSGSSSTETGHFHIAGGKRSWKGKVFRATVGIVCAVVLANKVGKKPRKLRS